MSDQSTSKRKSSSDVVYQLKRPREMAPRPDDEGSRPPARLNDSAAGEAPGIGYLIQVIQDLKRENQQIHAAVEHSPVGVTFSDPRHPDDPITFVNEALVQLTGYGRDEILGRNDRLFYGPETDGKTIQIIEKARANRCATSTELLGQSKDGEAFRADVALVPVLDDTGNLFSFVTVYTDSSERHALSELQERRRLDLARGPDAEFQFTANLIHELRTPLNAILGFADVLKSEIFGELPHPKYREYLRDILESGNHLLELVNEILDLSRADAGRLDLCETVIDAEAITHTCVKMVEQSAGLAKVRLSTALSSDLPRLYADERRVRQILINLLANAVKFTPAGGDILITADREPGGGLMLSVLDTGIGMAESDLPVAVAPFGQIGLRPNQAREGTGLGLPLTKRLLEAHGGSLEVLTSVGQGTIMVARFPAERVVD